MASPYPDTRNVVPKEALVAPDAARPRAGETALGALYGSRSSASWGSSDGAAAVLLTYYPHTGVFVDAVPVE
ncbi:MAG: hypothetical protein HFJ75_06360 [Eggerthellaceae bacterium]|nr:hypothetical protein [Eggerthellaceae bacterium]